MTYEDYLRAHFGGLRALIIELGRYCPVECRHCHVLSDRSTREHLQIEDLEKAIRSFAKLRTASFIAITGGEPFSYKNALISALRLTQEVFLKSFVLTSANWAKSSPVAKRVLKSVGRVDLLGFSLDSYHLEKQPVARTINGLNAAKELGISAFVALGNMGPQDEFRLAMKEILATNGHQDVQIIYYQLLSRGKGAAISELDGFETYNDPNEGCLSLGTPVVTASGWIGACCYTGVANATRAGKSGKLVLGHIRDPDSAWREFSESTIMSIIRNKGPMALASLFNVSLPSGARNWDACRCCEFVRASPEMNPGKASS